METSFNNLLETLSKLEGFNLISKGEDFRWIHFYLLSEESIHILASQIDQLKDQYACSLISLIKKDNEEDKSYQLLLEDENLENLIQIITKKINAVIEFDGDLKKALDKELGLPDLSLVTIQQMTRELKSRDNLTFALVWMESTEKENISIEGKGIPTQIVGLLTRGTHIAIEWADNGIKFKRPKDEQ